MATNMATGYMLLCASQLPYIQSITVASILPTCTVYKLCLYNLSTRPDFSMKKDKNEKNNN